eukprot:536621-Prorocentrum_minimum.AAC.1
MMRPPRFITSPPCHSNPFIPDGPHARQPSKTQSMRSRLTLQGAGQIPPSSRFKADFQELTELGSGSFGKVYKVTM